MWNSIPTTGSALLAEHTRRDGVTWMFINCGHVWHTSHASHALRNTVSGDDRVSSVRVPVTSLRHRRSTNHRRGETIYHPSTLGCFKSDAKRDHDGAASSPRKDPGDLQRPFSLVMSCPSLITATSGGHRRSGSMCARSRPLRRLKSYVTVGGSTSSSCQSPQAACPSCRRGRSPCQA